MLPQRTIPSLDSALAARVQSRVDGLTKPPGSLGRIEALALRLAVAQGVERPVARARLLLCAADHGLVAEGVSAWPQDVTALMVRNFLQGGAAANAFARAAGADLVVLDCGVAGDLPEHPLLRRGGLPKGSRNALREDALTQGEVSAALEFGASEAARAVAEGFPIVLLGEMGIGNTSSAALLGAAVTGLPLSDLVGPGAGQSPEGLARKGEILAAAAARRRGPLTPEAALAAFGGLEIAAMAGALIGAAASGGLVVVDGFIATAAALLALRARPEAAPHVVLSHLGAEPGHRRLVEAILAAPGGVEPPLLDLGLRLGEGTGALLALPLVAAAAAMLNEMASLSDLGIGG